MEHDPSVETEEQPEEQQDSPPVAPTPAQSPDREQDSPPVEHQPEPDPRKGGNPEQD